MNTFKRKIILINTLWDNDALIDHFLFLWNTSTHCQWMNRFFVVFFSFDFVHLAYNDHLHHNCLLTCTQYFCDFDAIYSHFSVTLNHFHLEIYLVIQRTKWFTNIPTKTELFRFVNLAFVFRLKSIAIQNQLWLILDITFNFSKMAPSLAFHTNKTKQFQLSYSFSHILCVYVRAHIVIVQLQYLIWIVYSLKRTHTRTHHPHRTHGHNSVIFSALTKPIKLNIIRRM